MLQLNNQKTTQSFKWAKDLNTHFSKEDIQVSDEHMERYSTLLAIRQIKIKTAIKYHFLPTMMASINKLDNNKCW